MHRSRRHLAPSRHRHLVVLATLAFSGAPVAAQVPTDHARRVDEIFARWDSDASAGCAVGVEKDGVVVLERAYGMADLEHAIPNTPQTIFEGGSVSKQFTAAAVMLLVLDGELSLTDDVRDYVPELPDYGYTITLKHLLTHTSGLRDWGSVASISGWGREQRAHDHAWVLDILSRQSALNFEPGAQYSYSNSGFNLLAVIVTRVSGKPFAEFSMERIFEPLGLEHTQWRDDFRRIVPGRSSAYDATGGGEWEINRPVEYVHGNGGILSTVGDLLEWDRVVEGGGPWGPEFVRLMHENGRLNDGSEIVYSSGLYVGEDRGLPSVWHTGSTAGYRAFLGRYPDQDLRVAMLCNASNAPTGGSGRAIASVYLGDAVVDPVAPEGIPLRRATLERYAGLYADPVNGDPKTIQLTAGGLRDGGTALTPLSETRFQAGSRQEFYVFHDDGTGRPWLGTDDWEVMERRFDPVEPWEPSRDDVGAFTGTYESDDAETSFRVIVDDGQLTLWRRPGVTQTLTPLYQDAFRGRFGTLIRFRRVEGAPAHELSLSIGRVFDMRFQRAGR